MGRGILAEQLREFEEIGDSLEKEEALKRREGYNLQYGYGDAIIIRDLG